jgi:hypothetical protein
MVDHNLDVQVPIKVAEKYTNLSASALVATGRGRLAGIFVASSSSGTIKIWDNTAGSTTVLVNQFSVSGATWYPLPFPFHAGCYITLGGTIDCTVAWT